MSADPIDVQVNAAKAARDNAEADLFGQQCLKEIENTRIQRLTANEHELHTGGHIADMKFQRAADIEHRIYHFSGAVDENTVRYCREHLTRWHRLSPDEPVEIMLTSPGGDAWHGMALVDDILALRARNLRLTITVRGTAASMGAILLQTADVRRMGPSSTLLLHKLSAGAYGTLDQLEDMTKWMNITQEQVYDLFALRCASAPNRRSKRLDREAIVAGMERRDWAVGPQEAYDLGLIDEIG